MQLDEWITSIQGTISEAILDCFKGYKHGFWNENSITGEVLRSLETNGTLIEFDDCRHKTKWESFKLSGKNETTYGDIALLVKTWLSPDEYVEGVAFFEAKRIYHKPPNYTLDGFSAIDNVQLERLKNSTPISRVLFYVADPQREIWSGFSLPTNHTLALSKRRGGKSLLLGNSEPWVSELTTYLRGLHLDYSDTAVKAMKAFAANGNFSYIMNIATTKHPRVDLQLDYGFFDQQIYKRVTDACKPMTDIVNNRDTLAKKDDKGPKGPR